MANLSCAKCGAEIIPGTSFCRSCGAPVESSSQQSEMQTAVLDEKVVRTTAPTKRFEARTTAEASTELPIARFNPGVVPAFTPERAPAPTRSRRGLVIVVLILLILLAAGLIGVKRARQYTDKILVNQRYTYPGARTVVNLGDAGGAVLQMETPDRLDKVSEWYVSTFKPSKIMRVPPATSILRDDTVTITLVGSEEGTSIVIKQVAP